MPVKHNSDEGPLSRHTGALPMGRVRPATLDESDSRATLLLPEAVLALTGPLPADLGPFEQHVASLIDGVRPVARLRSKSGVSSADLRIALAQLCDRGLLRLAGIVEMVTPSPRESALDDETMSKAAPTRVPAHVMAEIESMAAEGDE